MDTRTDINGFPAKYVLTKNPNDPTGASCVLAKVLDIPDIRDVSATTHQHPNTNPIRIPHSHTSPGAGRVDTYLHIPPEGPS